MTRAYRSIRAPRLPGVAAGVAVRLARVALSVAALSAFGPGVEATPTTAADPATQAEPGSELRVWLVTAGPGDAVWERYGHNAIRVLDTATGRDVSYNWGIFDFQQVDFIPRFLQGRMLYMMAPFQTQAMIDAYARVDREVVLQELDLTPSQKASLQQLADRNALPQNRDYFYQYFRDNCSTRVRDLLDRVLEGALGDRFGSEPTGTTYRHHTRRLTQVDPLIYTGMDLLLGTPTDQPITVWEEMFIPMTLRDAVRDVAITGADGTERPLVMSEEVAAPSSRPAESSAPPSWLPVYAALGLALGLLFGSMGAPRVSRSTLARRAIVGMAAAWSLLLGLGGTILVLLLFTDHTFAYWNENLFLFSPLSLAVAVLLPLGGLGGRWRAAGRIAALLVLGLASAGLLVQLLPISRHANAMFFALALPGHVGIAWALTRGPTAAGPVEGAVTRTG